MDVRLGLLVLTIAVGGTLAGPIQSSRNCNLKQCPTDSWFRYRPGQTYEFRYEGKIHSGVAGSSQTRSGMFVTSTAKIEVVTPCEFVLVLTDVDIKELDTSGQYRRLLGSDMFTRAVQAEPLRFSFHNGQIESVCAPAGEAVWITNFKRAVLSSFQNPNPTAVQNPLQKQEVDITGNCSTNYIISERSHSTVTVDRRKDLLSCTDRHGYKTAFQSTPYRVNSDIQSLPLTKSSHNCRHTFHNERYLSQAECTENHVFRPFSKENNGAVTQATHTLRFSRIQPGISATNTRTNFRRTNLLYEHENSGSPLATSDTEAREILRQTCEQAANDVRPETPKLFSELVYKLKQLDTNTLRGLNQAVQSGQVCARNINAAKKAFRDAVPMTGTVASVSLLSAMIRDGQVRDKEADMWLTSLAFIQQPKLEMIQSVKDLLSSGVQSQRNYLSTSALIHNYCRQNGNCQNEQTVQEVVTMLEGKLNGNCRVAQTRQEDGILMVLKALGNIGTNAAPSVSRTLGQCASTKENSMEIRLAALDALRQQPCEASRAAAVTLFTNVEEEDEVRISAYLSAMKCPDVSVINNVRSVLEQEKANQVGSFVWTHLTNLMESDDPHKSEIRQILNDVYLRKEFDMDRRKFSRNYDGSVFLDSINTGAKLSANLIFSRKSFAPRSGLMNITVDLFGHSVNLIEFGGRAEGMEQLLETYFGPEGYFPEKTVTRALRREKRQVADHKLNNVHRTYDGKGHQDNIKGSMYFKIFGNELAYFDLLNLRSASEFNILDILIKLAQNQEVEFKKNFMFLDTSIHIPTIVGLPLKLSVNGTASVDVTLSGKMDVRRAHPAPRSMDIDGKIRSSAAIQIASTMSVDANVARTGLRMVTTLHTSTEVDGQVKVQNSEVAMINFNMPREKQEIISLNNEFFTVHQHEEKPLTMEGNERVAETKCTGEKLVKMLGVELCGEVSYPLAADVRASPFYPLTGPSRMAIYLNKRDTHTAYQFEAKMLKERTRVNGNNQYKRTARLAFNTPGSQINRNMVFDFVLDQPNKAMRLEVDTPWKKLGLEGSLTNQPNLKRATLRLNLDEETEYSARAEVQIDEKPEGKVIYPTVNIKLPERDPIQLTGNIAYKHPSSVNFNLRLTDLFSTPVKFTGTTSYDTTSKRLTTDWKLECPLVDATAEGFFEMADSTHRSRFNLKYKEPQRPEESITLHYKLRSTRTGGLTKYSVDTSISNTIYPEYNNKLKWELQKTATHAETTIDFFHGRTMNDAQRRLQASIITNYRVSRTTADVDASVSLSYPAKDISFTARLDHEHHSRLINTKASVTYPNQNNVEVALTLNNLSNELVKLTSAFRLKYPGRDIVYRQAIDERQPDEFHHSLMIQWAEGRVFNSKDVAKKNGHRYSLDSEISCPNQSPIYMKGVLRANVRDGGLMISFEKDGRKYATEAGYQYSMQDKVDVKANLKFEMPGRKHDTAFNVLHTPYRTEAGFSYNWLKNGQPKLISFTLGANHRLNPEMDISGSIELKTPYQPVERIGARFQYKSENRLHTTNVAVTWSPEKTINLEGSGRVIGPKDFQLSGAVTTPFEGYRRISSNIRASILNKQFTLALNGQKEAERFDLELSASWNERLSGAFKFRVPNVAHSLQGGFSHQRRGNGHIINVNAVWDEQSYSAVLRGAVNSLWDVEAGVIVNTPISGYEKSEAAYKHFYQSSKVSGLLNLVFAGRQGKLQFEVENSSNYRQRDFLVTAEVVTPFDKLRLGKITLKYFDDGQRYTSQVSGMYNNMALGYDLSMNNNFRNKMSNGILRINTPIPGYQQLVYTWNHRFTANVLSTNKLEINGLQYSMRITGNHNLGSSEQLVTGQLTIESPHQQMRNAVLNIKYQNNAAKLVTSGTLSVNGNTAAFSLDATGSRRNRLVCNFNLNIEPLLSTYTPYSLKPVTASLTYKGQMSPRSLVAFVRYSDNKEVRLEGSFDYRGANYIAGSLVVNTPYQNLNRLAIQLTHVREGPKLDSRCIISWDNNQGITLKGVFQHGNGVTGEIGISTPFEEMSEFNFRYNHNRDANHHFVHTNNLLLVFRGNRITFDSGATYQGHRYTTAFARFTSPYERYQNLAYSFSTEKTDSMRTSSFTLELSPGKKSEITLKYALRPFDMTLNIKTPCHHLSSFNAKLGHVHRLPYIKTELSFDMVSFSRPTSGALNVEVQSLNDMTFRITGTNDVLIELIHKKNADQFDTQVKVQAMGKTLSAETKIDINSETPFGELKITTSYSILSAFNAYVRCNLREINFRAGADATFSDQTHRIAMTATPRLQTGEVTLVLTSASIDDVDLKVTYERRREGPMYIAGVETTYNNHKYNLDFKFQREGHYMSELTLRTPIPGYETSTISYLLDYERDSKLLLKFNLNTPHYLLKTLKLEYDHQGSWTNFIDKTVFNYDASVSRISYQDEWTVQGLARITGFSRLLTPFKNFEFTRFTLNHELQGNTYDTKATIEPSAGNKMEFENTLTMDTGIFRNNFEFKRGTESIKHGINIDLNDKIHANINLETSYDILPSATITFSHNINNVPMVTSLTAEVNNYRGPIALNTNFIMNSIKDVKLTNTLTTPFDEAPNCVLNFHYKLTGRTTLDTALTAGLSPAKTISSSFKMTMNLQPGSNEQTYDVKITTPFPVMSVFEYHGEAITREAYVERKENAKINGQVWKRELIYDHGSITYEEDHPLYKNRFTSAKVNGIRTSKWKTSWPSNERGVEIEMAYRLSEPMMKLSLKTPFDLMHDGEITLRSGAFSEYQRQGMMGFEITHNKLTDRLTGNVEWNMAERKANLLVTTAFSGYERFGLELGCATNRATIRLQTPIRGYESNMVTITYGIPDGSLFNTRVIIQSRGDKKIEVSLSANRQPSLNLNMKTPFSGFEEMFLQINYNEIQNPRTFTVNSKVQYMTGKVIEATGTLRPDGGEITFKSPWAELTVTHNGRALDFTTTAMATVRGVRSTAELQFKLRPTFTLKAEFTHPEYTGSFNLNGVTRNFRAVSSASWGQENLSVELNWALLERISAGLKVSGTVRHLEMISASFSHMYNGRQLSTSANAQWRANKRISSTLSYKRENGRYSAELKVNTPFEGYKDLNAGVFFSGNKLNFESGANAQYQDGKRIELIANYEHKKQGKLELKTPFQAASNVRLEFDSARVNNKDGYIVVAQLSPEMAVQMKVSGTMAGTVEQASIDGYMELSTPINDLRNLVLEAIHRHSNNELSTTLKADYNHDPVLHAVIDLDFSPTTLKGHASLIRPMPLKLTADLTVNDQMKTADLEFSWDTNNPSSSIKITGSTTRRGSGENFQRKQVVSLTLPSRTVSVKNEYTKTGQNTKVLSSFNWDQARNREVTFEGEYRVPRRNMWEVSGKVSTPLRTMLATFSHTAAGRRYTCDGEFSWDLVRAPQKKISVVAVTEIREKESTVEITIQPPRTHEIKLRHESKFDTNEFIFYTKNSLSYSAREEETLTMVYDIRDTLVGRHHNYSSSLTVSHPASNIKLLALGHFGASYRSLTAGMKLGYMKASGQMSEVHVIGEVDTVNNKGKLMISSPLRRIDLSADVTKDMYGYKVRQETDLDGQRVWWTWDLNKRNGSVNFDLRYDHNNPNKAFKVLGWYLPTEAVLQATHEDGQTASLWALVSAKLNSSNVLHTRLHWEPTLAQQIKTASSSGMNEINNALRYDMRAASTALNREASDRQRLFTVPDMSLTTNAIAQEATSFRSDYQATMDGLQAMIDNNEFFMRDAGEVASQTGEIISERVRVMRYQLRRAIADYRRRIKQNLATLRRVMDQFMAKLEEKIAAIVLKFRPAWHSYAYAAIKSVERTQQSLSNGWDRFQEQIAENNAAITRFFDDRFDFISYKMEPFWEKWTSLPDNIFSSEERNFFARLREKIQLWVQKIREQYNAFCTRFHDQILIMRDAVQQKVNEVMAKMMEYRAARVLVNYAKQVYYHTVDAWEAWEIPETLTRIAETLYSETRTYGKEYFHRLLKKYMRVENSGFTRFDPENGEIRAAIFLPLEVKQFDQMPKIDLAAAKLALRRLKDRYMPQGDYSFWDTYYKYKPSSNPLDWIPPFKAQAILSHGSHYTTFDGVHYDFVSSGTCSYVLARDFIDGNFTVVANYKNNRVHSMMVMTNGKNVEIFEDFKVTIDDHRRELPIQYMNTTIVRDGYKIRVHNEKGVTVTCDLYNKVCTTNVTGWYFGKTAGLFGTYNNEQDDEYLMANRRTTDDLNDFTHSWEIGNQCRGSRNVARQTPVTDVPEINSICNGYFKNKDSPFRPCFKQVDPKPYLGMCISDLVHGHDRTSGRQKRACSIASAYLAQCRFRGVDLTQDSRCVNCEHPNGGEYDGSMRLEEHTEKKADVVVLVEEKTCNRNVLNRLESIVNNIDNKMKAKGMRSPRFAVLGFGGRGVHDPVHVHTMEGQIFNEARKIRPALQSLDFTANGQNNDVLDALYQASRLTFRTGASKSIVVIPCSACVAQSIGFSALEQILSENAVHIHVMAEHDFTMRTNSPKTNLLFGIDRSSAYTLHHANQRELLGDQDLHRQVVMPRNLCSALALSQNGSVFNVQKLTEGRSRTQKHFVEIFARRVVKSASPLPCQVCDCVQDQDGVGRSVCRSCHMPSYNYFFKKFFPNVYRYAPTIAHRGSEKEERLPSVVAPRQLNYEEIDE